VHTLGKMIYGICVLTTYYEDEINGMIASWASQISYDPPLVLIAIHPLWFLHKLLEQSHNFAQRILAQNQCDFLSHFKEIIPGLNLTAFVGKKSKQAARF